ncbi:hypothetical protein KPNIH2_10945 [Klebsiella pneumoniae subsp. pneumoniae KPNIH2]|nr:hypothetical protein KPNIH2_10945 [Klebsiella pneumoniae subsp. pneumoniae KPNIH2]EJJ69052.1 hypothetical protein KPNIH9_15134 [Klebsiella pneumoniae subsp. pneumoniae KPNIH9]
MPAIQKKKVTRTRERQRVMKNKVELGIRFYAIDN